MDYTTLASVKSAGRITDVTDDAWLGELITQASRALDRICARSIDATDYFTLEDMADDPLTGQVDNEGHIIVWPHKPKITAITSLSYRFTPFEAYRTVDPAYITLRKLKEVTAWTNLVGRRGEAMVLMSYTGGFSGSPAAMPADFMNLVDLMVMRFYRETESGLSDAVGLSDLATATYTKALPARLALMIKPFVRTVPW
jgi:hypothetical protein